MFVLVDFEFSSIEPPLAALERNLSVETAQPRGKIQALIREIAKLDGTLPYHSKTNVNVLCCRFDSRVSFLALYVQQGGGPAGKTHVSP